MSTYPNAGKEDHHGLISIREFARRMDCSDTSVRKAIAAGKIVKGAVKNDTGITKIKYDEAFKEWQASYNPEYVSNEKIRTKLMANVPVPGDEPEAPVSSRSGSNLVQAKTAQAVYRAKLLEVELKQKTSQLVDKKAVYMALYEAGREVRTSIMTVPDRYIDAILGSKTRNEGHTILLKALIEALDVLSDVETKNILDSNGS